MNKSILLVLIIIVSCFACKRETVMNIDEVTVDSTAVKMVSNDHNAMNSLDYQGTYVGSLPCADCESIETTLILTDDSFVKEVVYKGKSKEIFRESGSFEWNKAGNTITLVGLNAPNQYFVGENILFHLDVNGKKIEGDLASKYELRKVLKSENKIELKNSKWKLIKIFGKDVENSNQDKLKGITFNSEGNLSAFAGCNSIGGTYEINEETNKIKFSKIITTEMACLDMSTEKELNKVLEIADNYFFDGNILKLNKGKMATLAEFVIIK